MASVMTANSEAHSEQLQRALLAGDAPRFSRLLRSSSPPVRLAHGRTPLMLAVTLADARAALALVDAALAGDAQLQAKDADKRSALMLACFSGASLAVVRRLWAASERRGGWELAWWHRDADGLDAVALASKAGHGLLAAQLLDQELNLERAPIENYPLKVLEVALLAGDERCAVDVMESRVMQSALRQKAEERCLTRNPWQENCTVFSCVEAAVKNGLPRALERMEQLNAADVAKATWFALYKQGGRSSSTADQIGAVGQRYWRDRVWTSVRSVVLLRHRGLQLQASPTNSDPPPDASLLTSALSLISWASPWSLISGGSRFSPSSKALAGRLATLPDSVFHLLLSFLAPSSDDVAMCTRFWLEARRCRQCGRLCIPKECRTLTRSNFSEPR